MDVISKAEFDSQRGSEDGELELEADSDLVFGPLDQEDVGAAPGGAAAPAKLEVAAQRSADQEAGHGKLSANGSSSRPASCPRRKDRSEKRARFYPVLNKQGDSPSKVGKMGRVQVLHINFVCTSLVSS